MTHTVQAGTGTLDLDNGTRRDREFLYRGIAALLFAAASGAGVAIFEATGVAVVLGIAVGAVSLFMPLQRLIALLLLAAFLLMGQLLYFARIKEALWIPFLLGLVLLMRYPAELIRRSSRKSMQPSIMPAQSPAVSLLLAAYFAIVIGGTLIHLNSPMQIFVSAKEYFFLWGLYLVIAAGLVSPGMLQRIWHLLPWLLPLQVPLVLYQRFVVADRRAVENLGAKWDAVVGAFGGNPDSGGSSGAMGLFVVFAITLVITRWREGQVRTAHCAVIVLSGLAAILLAEVKFAVFILPVAIAVASSREFVTRPMAAVAWTVVAASLAGGLFLAYKAQYSNAYQDAKHGGYMESVFSASADPDFINLSTREIGRTAAIKFWATQQTHSVDMLVGHGMGASRKGSMVTGDVAARWPFHIARSALAILLWETGILGTAAFIFALVAAGVRARRLAVSKTIPRTEQSVLAACAAGLVMLIFELPYNTDMFYSPQIQILLMLMLGQIAVSGGRTALEPERQ
ncbi:MAG TPA: hypothetical protein VGE12_14305 [Noviherbaspirillum sp.]